MIEYCKYLISVNSDLIAKTAMSNCHCIGLNSFIINAKPKIRLFIAEPNCELFAEFDYIHPIIPIHPHKYDDIFTQLEGTMINYIFDISFSDGKLYNKYRYVRLSDKDTQIKNIGSQRLKYWGAKNDMKEIKSTTLHTASLKGDSKGKCSWMVTETFEDKNFEQVAYHQNLNKRIDLYKPMSDGNEYLKAYFNIK